MVKKPVKYCIMDGFTDTAFKGNPAAVCMLEEAREEDQWLQAVASEFNLPVTCFLNPVVVDSDSDSTTCLRFCLRWFTPVAEIDLCGHATLAAAHFLFTNYLRNADKVEFLTLSGVLIAKKILEASHQNDDVQTSFSIELDFPVVPLIEYNSADTLTISKCLNLNCSSVVEVLKTTANEDLFVVLSSGKLVSEAEPQFDEIKQCPGRGMIICGQAPPGSGFDFYSRFFCPKLRVDEDPVCGSAHCALAPYWSKKLGKRNFIAYAASSRSGVLKVHFDEENQRVYLQGTATIVAEGSLLV